MQRIRFQPVSNLIVIPIKVMGIDGKSFRDVEVALDTGASTTSIPSYFLLLLKFAPISRSNTTCIQTKKIVSTILKIRKSQKSQFRQSKTHPTPSILPIFQSSNPSNHRNHSSDYPYKKLIANTSILCYTLDSRK